MKGVRMSNLFLWFLGNYIAPLLCLPWKAFCQFYFSAWTLCCRALLGSVTSPVHSAWEAMGAKNFRTFQPLLWKPFDPFEPFGMTVG